jgi:hypothetical protein
LSYSSYATVVNAMVTALGQRGLLKM